MRIVYYTLGIFPICATIASRPRGEMDITTVFGTVVGGSNPSEGTFSLENLKSGVNALYYPSSLLNVHLRASFSGRTRPCQGRDGSSILPARTTSLSLRSSYVVRALGYVSLGKLGKTR